MWVVARWTPASRLGPILYSHLNGSPCHDAPPHRLHHHRCLAQALIAQTLHAATPRALEDSCCMLNASPLRFSTGQNTSIASLDNIAPALRGSQKAEVQSYYCCAILRMLLPWLLPLHRNRASFGRRAWQGLEAIANLEIANGTDAHVLGQDIHKHALQTHNYRTHL